MAYTARTIFAIALVFGLAVALGCGSKPEPTQPNVGLNPEPTPGPGPNPDPGVPKVEPKAVWEMDPAKHAIPSAAVKGSLAGKEVTLEAAVEGNDLVFRVPKATPERKASFKLRASPDQSLEKRTWTVRPDAPAG